MLGHLRISRSLMAVVTIAAVLSSCGAVTPVPVQADVGESVNMQRVRDASPALRTFARQYVQSAAYWPDLKGYQSRTGRRFSLDRDIQIGEADLNDDGLPERFLIIDNPLFCSASGCTTYVLQKYGRNWRILLQNNVRAEIRVLDETDSGYHRLCMARRVESWDGTQYQPIPSGLPPATPTAKPTPGEEDLTAFVTCDDGDMGPRT
jgi:hypothetical protein